MTRLLLILIMFIQLSGCAVFWTTAGATLVGNVAAEVVKDKIIDKSDKDEAPQP